MRDADEQVFDVLNLPDAQRAAIRAIEDQYFRALRSTEPPGGGAGVNSDADQTRRTAITNVLGADGLHAFTFAERKEERRVSVQRRAESLRGHL